MQIPVHHREPTQEPKPNAFSKATFEEVIPQKEPIYKRFQVGEQVPKWTMVFRLDPSDTLLFDKPYPVLFCLRDSLCVIDEKWNKYDSQTYHFGTRIGTFKEDEDSKVLLNGYYTLIIFVTSWIIAGAILATITMFAIYGTAIERGNLVSDTDEMIGKMQYNTDEIHRKVNENNQLLNAVNVNIEKLGTGIVEQLKPKQAKIVENQ